MNFQCYQWSLYIFYNFCKTLAAHLFCCFQNLISLQWRLEYFETPTFLKVWEVLPLCLCLLNLDFRLGMVNAILKGFMGFLLYILKITYVCYEKATPKAWQWCFECHEYFSGGLKFKTIIIHNLMTSKF